MDYSIESEKLLSKYYGGRPIEMLSSMRDAISKPIIRHGIVKVANFENLRKKLERGHNVEVGDLVIEVHESSPKEKEWASKMLRKVGFPFDERIVEVGLCFFVLFWFSQMSQAQLTTSKLLPRLFSCMIL